MSLSLFPPMYKQPSSLLPSATLGSELRLEQAIPPRRTPSPALRPDPSSRYASRSSSPMRDSRRAGSAGSSSSRSNERLGRSRSPRPVERPAGATVRSRTPPLAALPALSYSASPSPSPSPPPVMELAAKQTAYAPRPPLLQKRSEPTLQHPHHQLTHHQHAISHHQHQHAANQHSNHLHPQEQRQRRRHARQWPQGREPPHLAELPPSPFPPPSTPLPPPPPPPKNDLPPLPSVAYERPGSAGRMPRIAVPSMVDYLSLEQLEALWRAHDRYGGSIFGPQRPRGISHDKILQARSAMPEQSLGVHPALREPALLA